MLPTTALPPHAFDHRTLRPAPYAYNDDDHLNRAGHRARRAVELSGVGAGAAGPCPPSLGDLYANFSFFIFSRAEVESAYIHYYDRYSK
jgi:hypothetical protein